MILSGATVVTSLDPVRIEHDDLHIVDDRIAASGGADRRDCSGCLIVPGNVCTHTHLYSALARGMPYTLDPPTSFTEILQRIWWRLDRALDEETIRASALVGGMEALLSGTTTLVDHHASPNAIDGSLDIIAEALASLGVRSVLCYETSDRDGLELAHAGVAENRRFLDRVRREQPLLTRGMVGAHASFTLSDRAQIIGLTVGKGGLPADAEERAGIAAEIMARAMEFGVPLEDIYLDPLVLQVATSQDHALKVVKAVRMFQELNDPPMKTVVGLTNISNGCPKHVRPIVNNYYLSLLQYEGLTAAIADPHEVSDTVKTIDVILGNTLYAHSYLEM